jgi:membrane associated rhomboid family serine protease
MWIACFLAVILTTLVMASYLAAVIIELAVAKGRWQPIVCGCALGLVALLFGHLVTRVPPLRFVYLPLVITAVGTALACHKADWKTLLAMPSDTFRFSIPQNLILIVSGVLGALLAVSLEVGRPVLIALDYDVRGQTPGELRDVAVAGAVLGFLVSALVAALIVAAIARRTSRQSDHR